MTKTSKKQIVEKIQKRFGGELSQHQIKDAVKVIVDLMILDLVADRPVSVDNFGTLSLYEYPGHHGMNIATGERVYVEPFRTVRLHPHIGLEELVVRQKRRLSRAPMKKSGRSQIRR